MLLVTIWAFHLSKSKREIGNRRITKQHGTQIQNEIRFVNSESNPCGCRWVSDRICFCLIVSNLNWRMTSRASRRRQSALCPSRKLLTRRSSGCSALLAWAVLILSTKLFSQTRTTVTCSTQLPTKFVNCHHKETSATSEWTSPSKGHSTCSITTQLEAFAREPVCVGEA